MFPVQKNAGDRVHTVGEIHPLYPALFRYWASLAIAVRSEQRAP